MFDKIHFQKNPFIMHDGVTGTSDYSFQISHSPKTPSGSESTLETTITNETDFLLQGEIEYLTEQPMSPENRKQYLYLQGFSLLKMGQKYYTSRKNYPSYLIVYTYQGKGELIYNHKTYTLQTGDGFLIDCKKPHTYRTIGEYWMHGDLHISGGNSDFLYQELFRNCSPVFSFPTDSEFQVLLEDLLQIHTSVSTLREVRVSCAIQRLLIFIAEAMEKQNRNTSCPENIRYLMKYMELHFRDNLSLDDLSALAGLSKYHFCRQFKKYTSFSPKEYLTQLRMNQAKQLLTNTSIPAYKIGILCGIPNEANFIRLFEKNFGITPGEFRKGCAS